MTKRSATARIFPNAFFICASLVSSVAMAQAPVKYYDPYDKTLANNQQVVALDSSLLGEKINPYDGTTRFEAVDLSLPGNNKLAVEFRRAYEVTPTLYFSARDMPIGDWDIDIPHLYGTYRYGDKWPVATATHRDRCSSHQRPPLVRSDNNATGVYFGPNEYWHGNFLHMPGEADELMLAWDAATNPNAPSSGTNSWTTKNGWFFQCLPDSETALGEGFLAIAPDGTKYYFDKWMSRRKNARISKVTPYVMFPEAADAAYPLEMNGFTFPNGSFYPDLGRWEFWLAPSKVVDVHGNSVTYAYEFINNSWKVKNVSSSDGRTISITHDTSTGLVKSATDGTRTLNYTYGTNNTLTKVAFPNGSAWNISFGNLSTLYVGTTPPPATCEASATPPLGGTPTGWIQSPSGARGDFVFAMVKHGRSYVPKDCRIDYAYGGTPVATNRYGYLTDSLGITSKTLAGPGVASGTWTYTYGAPNNSWAENCSAQSCVGTKTTSVKDPAGRVTLHTFGNQFGRNVGLLLADQLTGQDGVGYRTEANTYYDPTNPGSITLRRFGVALVRRDDAAQHEYPRPLAEQTQTIDGVSFSRKVTAYDAFYNPTSVQEYNSRGYSRTRSYQYLNSTNPWLLSKLLVETDAETGKEIARNTYDPAKGLLTSATAFGILQATLTYNAVDGTLATVTDGRNNTTTLSNWKRGVPQSIKHPATAEAPAGAIESAVVNNLGALDSVTDELLSTTNYGHDVMGRVNRITYPALDSVTWSNTLLNFAPVALDEYGLAAGHWKQTTQTGSGLTTTYYDAFFRPAVIRTEDINVPATRKFVVKRYDAAGRESFSSYPVASLTTVNDALPGTRTTYDPLDRVTKVQQDSELGVLLTTTTEYLPGFLTKVTNPRLYTTTTSYQVFATPTRDAPVKVIQDINLSPLDRVTTMIARDDFDKPTSITRFGTYNAATISNIVNYVYDANERLCKRVTRESGASLFDYDAAGNLAWSVDGSALTGLACNRSGVLVADMTVRTYDALNRPLSVDIPKTTDDLAYTYYPDGALKTLTSGITVWDYTYNKRRLMEIERLTMGARIKALTHAYNADGSEASITYPSGLTVDALRNGLGQATQAGSFATGVKYYPNGAIKSFNYGNGIVHTMTPNARQLPDRSLDQKPGSPSVLDDSYDYDYNGNIAAISDGVVGGGGNRTMSYDGLDRLLSTHAPNLAWIDAVTTYDPLDNIRSSTVGSRTFNYTYNTANQLSQLATPANVVVRSLGYDARGNVTTNGGATNVFDGANRLTSITGKESYLYDGYGRRVRITRLSDGKVSYPVYSASGQLMVEEDSRTNTKTDYVWLNGSLVGKRSAPMGTTTWTHAYEHTDALGSLVTETDANGVAFRIERYTPYGEPTDLSYNPGPGFTGHVTDSATGLSYMQQRYYDPVIGRFLSVDPVSASTKNGGNLNRYWYGNNNPFSFIDPDGRYTCTPPGCVVFAAALNQVRTAATNPKNSPETSARLNGILSFYGRAGERNGVVISNAHLEKGTLGNASTAWGVAGAKDGMQTTINVDVSQSGPYARSAGISTVEAVAGTLVHEGDHGASQRLIGMPISKNDYNLTELSAYTSGAIFERAIGKNTSGLLNRDGSINSLAVGRAADASVKSACSKGSIYCE
jgi:RHS repeat-associated protein